MSRERSVMHIVARKELTEVLRDRRTLVFMIVLPLLLMPVILQLTTSYMRDTALKAATDRLDYALFGAENLPALEESLAAAPAMARVEGIARDEVAEAIASERIDFALVVAPAQEPGPRVAVELHFDNAAFTSGVEKRAKQVITHTNEVVRLQRLSALGVSGPEAVEATLEPVPVVERGTAGARELIGERVGGMLPYFLIPFCFIGALYPAIDLGAGEKERGTLETLLLAPVRRYQLVLGKFLVVFLAGMCSALLTLAGLGGWLAWATRDVGGEIGEVLASIGPLDLVLVGVMLVPVTAMFAALLLAISIYAKSFKEGQSYAAPLNIMALLPAFVAVLPGVALDWKWAFVPITNVSLGIKEVVKGTLDPLMLVAIIGSMSAIAGALLWWATRWFSRESVLFRS